MSKRLLIYCMLGLLVISSACQPTPTAAPIATLPPPPTNTLIPPPTNTPIPPSPSPTPAPSLTPTATGPVLEIISPSGSKQLTMEELKALPATEGYAGIKSSTGKITPPAQFKGVSLKDLAALVGGMDASMGINVEAKDGYAITYSYDQVMNGTFIAYDPGTGDELKRQEPLVAIIAYEREGQPLPEDTDGTLRLAIVTPKPDQVTDGHWAVKWVTKVEIKSLGENWTLHLEGTLTEDMDRATFESGAAPNCHGVTWKDDKAQDWSGIPLWYLVGRVDDTIKHEGPAFNDALADMKYKIDVVGKDGYTVTLDSQRVKRNDNIIVANLVNGNPLPDDYFPLRLVGSDLSKKEMVGQIVKIVLHLEGLPTPIPPTPVPTATTAPATGGAGTLTITGLVEKTLTLSEADLRKMEVVKITAEQPKKGQQNFEGVRLNTLLDLAKVKSEAKKLVITAGDGYTTEVFLAEARACADCLVAFTDKPGEFFLVMPGLPGNTWVKNVVKIEVM